MSDAAYIPLSSDDVDSIRVHLLGFCEYEGHMNKMWEQNNSVAERIRSVIRHWDVEGAKRIVQAVKRHTQTVPLRAANFGTMFFHPSAFIEHFDNATHEQRVAMCAVFDEPPPDDNYRPRKFWENFCRAVPGNFGDVPMKRLLQYVGDRFLDNNVVPNNVLREHALRSVSSYFFTFFVSNAKGSLFWSESHLMQARNVEAVRAIIAYGVSANACVPGSYERVVLMYAQTRECAEELVKEGALPELLIPKRERFVPPAQLLRWMVQIRPSFKKAIADNVELIFNAGRTMDYLELLRDLEIELPRHLFAKAPPQMVASLYVIGCIKQLPEQFVMQPRWLQWRPWTHKFYKTRYHQFTVKFTLLVLKRMSPRMPKDMRFRILTMIMN